jgi:hypothetical protein
MPDGDPAAVAWWHGEGNAITSWLLVGPPPAPLTGAPWLHQLAVTRGPGAWAVASQPSLGPLSEPIAARLSDPFGPAGDVQSAVLGADGVRLSGEAADDLRDQCLEAALELVAGRLAQPIEPREMGVVLMRLRAGGARASLDIAPAVDEEGWLGRAVHVDLRGARVRWNAGASAPLEVASESFGEGTVTLGTAEMEIPIASLELALPEAAVGRGDLRAAIDVTLPTLWHAEVPEPVVTLGFEASQRSRF